MHRPTAWTAMVIVLASWPLAWLDTPVRAVWPPVVALAVIVATRHALAGLLIGGFCGAVIPDSSDVEKMGLEREPLACYAPRTAAAAAVCELWGEIRERLQI